MVKKDYRLEKDSFGSMDIPTSALYGIHSMRAKNNFPDKTPFQIEWYNALGTVKKACIITAKSFFEKVEEQKSSEKLMLKSLPTEIFDALIKAATEIEEGKFFKDFIVPAISGGAGTSINMNINEILANRSLQLIGKIPGNYEFIDPIEHVNLFQSTNDVVPTSLKIAIMRLLIKLEDSINNLRQVIEKLEKKHQNHIRLGYTQLQEAVPTSFGKLFSTYCDALSRDWWRISKCLERIKVVNIGGSAIGSGITVPRYFIMEVSRKLQELTNLPVARSENLYDATNNLDSIVEVHGILKTLAVNFEKISSDIRLLSSDIHAINELEIPQKQTGSSIMPGKVNPVISEFVISCSHKVYANDSLIAGLAAQGCLELNAYLPTIGHAIIESIKLLTASADTLKTNLFEGIVINEKLASEKLLKSPSITTVLVPYIGYNKAAEIAKQMKMQSVSITELNSTLGFMKQDKLIELLKPQNLLKEGFTLNDLSDNI